MVKGEAEGHELNRRDETLALSSLAKSIIALVRKTYDNLFRFFSAPHGARSLHRSPRTRCKARRLLGGGSRPMEPGHGSLAPRRGARTKKRPVHDPTVPVLVR
jgi:hypothetical protein